MRRLLLIGAVAVSVLVLAGVGLRVVQGRVTDPTDPVDALLDRIADADAGALAGHIDTDPLLLAEGYTPPEDLRTTGVTYGRNDPDTRRPNRNAATVHIAYRIGGTTHTAFVRVQREPTGWIRSWEITDPGDLPGELVIASAHVDHVMVAGADVPTTAPARISTTVAIPVLPGIYTLSTSGDEELFVSSAPLGEVTVPGADSRVEITVDPAELQVRENLRQEIAEQVAGHLDTCVADANAAATLSPSGCPLRVDRAVYRSVREVTWALAEYPEITVVPAESGLHGEPLEVRTITPGAADASWFYAYTDDEAAEEAVVDITVAGTVSVDSDGAALWRP
ncbi:hypothetical protein [Nocardiopsis sp. CC223A]|uniref:hypothetical protein n=1 Tax=Nocardiopsis sp. CC223A TaxID=3044051 RepID=UPI00278C0159|nr:hypothetical protein [Nocardiopsis sp. CC223A]